jgi:hypothetical protein
MSVQRIQVFVDGRPVRALAGERVVDAVRRHQPSLAADLERSRAWVADGRGEPVGIHGALEEGERLYVRKAVEEPGPEGAAEPVAGPRGGVL